MTHTEMVLISDYLNNMLETWKNKLGLSVVHIEEIELEFSKLRGLILHERSK